MSRTPREDQAGVFEHSLLIMAAPTRVLAAFFDPAALTVWWQVIRSVTAARPLGIYAVEWAPTPFEDDVLGPLGGVFYGVVIEYRAGHEFFVADAYWLPPRGEPIGPMALEVRCRMDGPATRLRVRQSGYEESERWLRYYAVIASGWQASLRSLKFYLEQGGGVAVSPDASPPRTVRAPVDRSPTGGDREPA